MKKDAVLSNEGIPATKEHQILHQVIVSGEVGFAENITDKRVHMDIVVASVEDGHQARMVTDEEHHLHTGLFFM
jgi:ABC-type polar amino acid transport system ATPase subunit